MQACLVAKILHFSGNQFFIFGHSNPDVLFKVSKKNLEFQTCAPWASYYFYLIGASIASISGPGCTLSGVSNTLVHSTGLVGSSSKNSYVFHFSDHHFSISRQIGLLTVERLFALNS